MNTSKLCPNCGAQIPPEAPQGLCPKCVLGSAATAPTQAIDPRQGALPSVETVRAAFPQLEILEFLGAGGMGAVYKARQPKLDRVVALKVLPEHLAAQPGFADRFSREARLLARLNHPNIVGVFDFGSSASLFYLVMEYVDGVNLREAMRAGRFSPTAALGLVPQICDALQYAHGEGILHRDIKPENILLDAKGRIKIADFGIAKLVQGSAELPPLTVSGQAVGTPNYMAPEQLEKPNEVDQRADIYSLGVVFYEMLTGELPIGRFALPSEKSPVDPRVDPIVLKALEKERERRYASVGEVKTSLAHMGAPPAQKEAPPVMPTIPTTLTARGATTSLVLSLLSLLPSLLFFAASFFMIRVARSGSGPTGVSFADGVFFLVPTLIILPLAIAGAGTGVWALVQIRRSQGQLGGTVRAMIGTFLWPMLALLALSSCFIASILGGFVPNSPKLAIHFGLTVAGSLGLCIGASFLLWRWLQGAAQPGFGPMAAAMTSVLLLPALLSATVAGAAVAQKQVSRAGANALRSGPVQIESSEAYRPAGTASARTGFLRVSFGVGAAHGVIAELLINDAAGIRPLPGGTAFLLASPAQAASSVMTWTWAGSSTETDSAEDAPRFVASWGSVNSSPGSTNDTETVVLPPRLSDRLAGFSSNATIGWLEDGQEQMLWFLERNGPAPGVGVRLKSFPHPLQADEIAGEGFRGYGTNWLAQVRQ